MVLLTLRIALLIAFIAALRVPGWLGWAVQTLLVAGGAATFLRRAR
jgi:hypothetical protein